LHEVLISAGYSLSTVSLNLTSAKKKRKRKQKIKENVKEVRKSRDDG